MRPITKIGYSFKILADTNYTHGTEYQDERTAQDILQDIKDVRNSISPVELVDMLGEIHTGYVTAIQEMPITRETDGGGEFPSIDYVFQINFVEI